MRSLLLAALACSLSAQVEIERHGVTWTLAGQPVRGTFANGDPWVVGPVTVTRITPLTAVVEGRTINGSMTNPDATGRHGYDSKLYDPPEVANLWRPELNVAAQLPATLPPGTSLISAISRVGASPNAQAGNLLSASILTVLPEAAPQWAFRPPYAGSDKTLHWRASGLQIGLLRSLPAASGAPGLPDVEQWFQRPWLSHAPGWWHQGMHPCLNMPTYYREFGNALGDAALLLQTDLPIEQKWPLLVGLIQVGIDHWGVLRQGMRWDLLGHSNGRKFPIVFAGALTGYSPMTLAGFTYETRYHGVYDPRTSEHPWFAEDGQTFYVEETAPGQFNWGYGGYGSQHVGMPEWGNQHALRWRWGNEQSPGPPGPSGDNVLWSGEGANPYRVCCSATSWVGWTLAIRLMGGVTIWNHPAHFDYMDRYMLTETGTQWHTAMWRQYR